MVNIEVDRYWLGAIGDGCGQIKHSVCGLKLTQQIQFCLKFDILSGMYIIIWVALDRQQVSYPIPA